MYISSWRQEEQRRWYETWSNKNESSHRSTFLTKILWNIQVPRDNMFWYESRLIYSLAAVQQFLGGGGEDAFAFRTCLYDGAGVFIREIQGAKIHFFKSFMFRYILLWDSRKELDRCHQIKQYNYKCESPHSLLLRK